MADLSGRYKSFVWFCRDGVNHPPGTMVILSHEEAMRALEHKSARPLTDQEIEAVEDSYTNPVREPEASEDEPQATESVDDAPKVDRRRGPRPRVSPPPPMPTSQTVA